MPGFIIFRSLRWQLIVLSFVGMGLLGLGMIYVSQKTTTDLMAQDVKAMVARTTIIMNMAMAPISTAGGLANFGDFLSELLLPVDGDVHSGITYIVVVNQAGQRLLRVGNAPAMLAPPDSAPETAFMNGEVHIRQALLLKSNHVGYLQYGLSTQEIVKAVQASRQQLRLMMSGMIVLFTGMVFLLGLRLAVRLERLVKVATRVASGDYSLDDSERGGDEVAQLSRHLNIMTQAIADRVSELETTKGALINLNANLESMVTGRTRQLHEKTQQLEKNFAELNQTRDQLIKSDRLVSLGSMVAGVAHELNTPIGNAMLAGSTLLETTLKFERDMLAGLRRSSLVSFIESVKTGSDLIERNLNRAAALIGSFKQVAVNQTADRPRPFDLGREMKELVVVLSPGLKKTSFVLNIDIPEGIVMTSYLGSLEQLVTNLVNNAIIHAFAGRSTGTMLLSAHRLDVDRVTIRFADDGNGMTQDILSKIFDPFFSTRLGQGGSGLGLSIAYNIVTMLLNGSIMASSQPGAGTTFVIDIPLVSQAATDQTMNGPICA